jgi:nucleotide-binding universal stress UspA family protein
MNILLATDGSDCARQALEYLVDFPFPADSRISLLTVLDKEAFRGRKKPEQLSNEEKDRLEETRRQIRKEGEDFLEQQAQALRGKGRAVSTLVRSGHPAEEIVLAAGELSADLIIVGSHGRTAAKRFLLGSVSDQVLRYAPCSVLIVKQPTVETSIYSDRFLRILLAYDDSVPAKRAVEFMSGLPLGDETQIRVLSVLPVIKLFRQDIKQRLTWVWQEKKLAAEKALTRITHEVRWGHPEVETELLESEDVSQAILDAAARDKSDLIVLGHKGKGAIDRFLLGSVTSHIAHHAQCSVLAVRTERRSNSSG